MSTIFAPNHGQSSPRAAASLRHLRRDEVPAAWAELREALRTVWQGYEAALPLDLSVRYAEELNPPLWELGHIGWFEEFWIARNPQRLLGIQARAECPRAAPVTTLADCWYDSSAVAHTRRWHLDLPGAKRTWQMLDRIRRGSLALLAHARDDDAGLYPFRLSALHEAMHLEAWVYMAQALAIDLRGSGSSLQPGPCPVLQALAVPTTDITMGSQGPGFVFDNECEAHPVTVPAFEIDSTAVTWARFLPFVAAGGYDEPRWWSTPGWAWRQRHSTGKPLHLALQESSAGAADAGGTAPDTSHSSSWKRAVFGRWEELTPQAPAVHLSLYEAEAWCRWAGRRLPTEAEWVAATVVHPQTFAWGQVWEWTATPFSPFPGFQPHPYADYSQPWFGDRPVLRGASFATWPGFVDARYRNFFPGHRRDIFAGFRSCAV